MPKSSRLNIEGKQAAWIEIDRQAIIDNIGNLTRLAGRDTSLSVAVKANGYGHGLPQMIAILAETNVPYIAVHSSSEADLARSSGWTRRIMMVGPILPDDIDAIFRLDLEPLIVEPSLIEFLGKFCRRSHLKVRGHIKIETGTNRQGMDEKELAKAAILLKKYPEVALAGASTHFANIEDTTDHHYAMTQLAQFKKAIKWLNDRKLKPELKHTACSAALLLFQETYFDLARPGIAVYGYWPSKETYVSYRLSGGENRILTPALSLRTRLTQIKKIAADSFIGYGCTYRTSAAAKIAIIPVGYSDGLDRRLSNLGYVLVKGKRAPIRGRVCMNLTMIDITDIPGAKLHDIATIIGRDGEEQITADTHASWCQTINYEILSRLSSSLPRYIR